MTTIQFTFDKKENQHCFGYWIDGKWQVRACGIHKDAIWEQFIKELKWLEGAK